MNFLECPKDIDTEEKRILNSVEIAQMINSSFKNRDQMLLKAMYFIGLTSGDIQKITVEDIDFHNKTARISNEYKHEYKTIPEGFIEELKEWVSNRTGPLFPGRNQKGFISDRHVRRIVKKCAQLSGIEDWSEIKAHSLKHAHRKHISK